MNYGEIKKFDIANGPGVRVSLFVSGCRHCCYNCFNRDTWEFGFGKPFTGDTANEILTAMKPDYISGFSLLGGEPFEPENQPELLTLLKKIRQNYHNKNIWCYTGFLLDSEILGESRAKTDISYELLKQIDVLVDGRFVEDLKDISLKFRGSSNQRIIDVPATLKSGKIVLYNV